MATTPHLGISLVEQSQAQKEVTVNEALKFLDSILNTGAIDKDIATPPGSPSEGDIYIVAASATGDWAGKDLHIACFDQIWRFIAPNEGLTIWVNDENLLYAYDGAAWSPVAAAAPSEAISILPPAMFPSSSNGCAAAAVTAIGAGQPDIVTLDFDPATQEYAEFALPMRPSWNEGTITARFLWSHPAAATNFGVVWTLQASAFGDGDSLAVSYATTSNQLDTGGVADTLYFSPVTGAITIANSPAQGDMVYFRVSRVATHVNDTLAVDARLHAVQLFITRNSPTDA